MNRLKLGIPKGSLENATIELFKKSGWKIQVSSRNYFPDIDDKEITCTLVRAQEMSRYVENGTLDLGLTGKDWIMENGSDVVVVADLVYSKASTKPARWVLVVRQDSPINKPEELRGKKISTELVSFTKNYFAERKIPVEVEFSWGATEVKARLMDAIVDVTETGSSLRANRLRVIDTVMTSNTQFIANRESWEDPWKREKIESLAMLIQGAINAKEMVGLKMNVPMDLEETIKAMLPAEKSPTVTPLADMKWLAMEVVLPAAKERELVPRLKRAGATGIIVYPLNKVIH